MFETINFANDPVHLNFGPIGIVGVHDTALVMARGYQVPKVHPRRERIARRRNTVAPSAFPVGHPLGYSSPIAACVCPIGQRSIGTVASTCYACGKQHPLPTVTPALCDHVPVIATLGSEAGQATCMYCGLRLPQHDVDPSQL